ncbi:MAG: HU family DNA-binding protein [Bacteroidales bacterium]|jgi:predicted histone-like DNA-binding protein|nr:HU family DNA-binding protein [Bacteroidales bacterium]
MKYKILSKANPLDRSAAPKYYASPVYAGEIELKRIAEEIAALSSLSTGDVYNTLINFVESLPKYLKDGYKLRLGDFGIFKVSFGSAGAEDPQKVSASQIKNRKILYMPGKDIRNSLNDMHFEQESSLKTSV